MTNSEELQHEISERKRLEAELRILKEALDLKQKLLEIQDERVRKEKMAVLGQVARNVGHELRNPLGVINNAVYFLQAVLTDADETTMEYLGIIKNEIATADHILTDLLDAVRTKPPSPTTVDIRKLLSQALNECAVPPNITV